MRGMPWIRVIEGPDAGAAAALGDGPLTIGRDARNGLRIGDAKSSRVHAEVACSGGQYSLTDLGSSNGTWKGEDRLDSAPLSDGFTFRIGKTVLRFEADPPPAASGGIGDPDRLETLGDGPSTLLSLPPRVPAAPAEAEAPARPAARSEPPAPAPAPAPATAIVPGLKGPSASTLLSRINTYLVLLHQMVVKGAKAHGREQLFELLDEAAAEALEGDRCAVFLPVPPESSAGASLGGWTLYPGYERRLRARYGAVPFARTLLAAVRQRPAPTLCTLAGDLAPSASMVQAGVRSAMAAPVRVGGSVDALLYVDRIAGERPFVRADLEFLAAVANQLAVQLHEREQVAGLEAEVRRLHARPAPAAVAVLHQDASMAGVEDFIAKAASSAQPVLIVGESGTGRELVARAIHQRSPRAREAFQMVACAGLEDAEAALFGSAPAPGQPARPGLAELADRGTLFLDEVDALPPAVQARLPALLDRQELTRAGDGALRRVDVRVVACCQRDLAEEVAGGKVRADLVNRLDVLTLSIPPLRRRPADIDLLAAHFLAEAARRLDQPVKRLAPEARALLLRHPWPGNVRQLKNAIERACALADGPLVRAADLPEAVRQAGPAAASAVTPITTLAEVERAHILRVLEHCGGNKKAAAELLGIDRSTLYAKLRQYGVGT
jgi:DNA-binding NtrC family response regulator